MKTIVEKRVCDFGCGPDCYVCEENYLETCEVCGKDYCGDSECGLDEDWQIPDSRLCAKCGNELWNFIAAKKKEMAAKLGRKT